MVIFADHTTIIIAEKRIHASIKRYIVTVPKWFKSSKLIIITDKFGKCFLEAPNLITWESCRNSLSKKLDHVVKNLKKICGLKYKVGHFYQIKW